MINIPREEAVKIFLRQEGEEVKAAIEAITPEERTHLKRKKEKEKEAVLVKQILTMAFLEHKTTKEICEKLGLTDRHIRTLKRRGYALIKMPAEWEELYCG